MHITIFHRVWYMEAHYQMLPINFLKEFIALNVNADMIIKNVKHLELNLSIATVFLNT